MRLATARRRLLEMRTGDVELPGRRCASATLKPNLIRPFGGKCSKLRLPPALSDCNVKPRSRIELLRENS